MSNPSGWVGGLRRRVAGYLRWAFRPSQPGLGWDPREATLLGVALFLLILSAFVPWWGLQRLTGDPLRPVVSGAAIQFGPWLATYFSSMLSPAGFSAEANPRLWWDVSGGRSAHAAFTPVSAALCGLWSAAFILATFAMWARAIPRRRMKGWPTIAEAATLVLVLAAVMVAYVGFPFYGHLPSFWGSTPDDTVFWSPALGWFFAVFAVILTAGSSFIGHQVDRKLVGVCWFCFRPVTGAKCDHCGSIQ